MNRIAWITPTLLLLPALVLPFGIGCSGPAASTTASSGAANTESDTQQTAQAATVVKNGVGTEPAQAVGIFLDSLRRGDEIAANRVLTQKAREELAKTDWVIEPLGTPEGQFKIGRVAYPYVEKDVALVECLWTEPPMANQAQITMDIVCEVHQESEGWRISGLVVTVPGTQESVVLDFEDAVSLQATIDAATGPSSTSQQTPQSQQTSQPGQLQTQVAAAAGLPSGLPAYPNPGGQIDVSNTAPPLGTPPLGTPPLGTPPLGAPPQTTPSHIALPPAYNQTEIR